VTSSELVQPIRKENTRPKMHKKSIACLLKCFKNILILKVTI
jgi:hypothetical protein